MFLSADPAPGTPPQPASLYNKSPKNTYDTPKGPKDLIQQLKRVEKADEIVSRDIRNLVNKASKALATYLSKLAHIHRENENLRITLDRYASEIFVIIKPNPKRYLLACYKLEKHRIKETKSY